MTSCLLDVLVLSRKNEDDFPTVSEKIDKAVSLNKSGREFQVDGAAQAYERPLKAVNMNLDVSAMQLSMIHTDKMSSSRHFCNRCVLKAGKYCGAMPCRHL